MLLYAPHELLSKLANLFCHKNIFRNAIMLKFFRIEEELEKITDRKRLNRYACNGKSKVLKTG